MTHALVTGAQGFIGRVLVQRLLAQGLGGQPLRRLSLLDQRFDAPHADPRVVRISGSVADAAARAQALQVPVDAVFHLASVPGGAAEENPEMGRRVNLDATVRLLEACQNQPRPPRFVYTSTVAVYGEKLPPVLDESTLPSPALSYGAHKLACEHLVADATRRGWVQGCSLRLPGVVARPGEGVGLMSAFMSQMFWKLAAGQQLTLPVAPSDLTWWVSAQTCVKNLLHAATVDIARLDARRSYQMPVLHLSMAEVVAALAERFGADRKEMVRYQPDPRIQRLFAQHPPLLTPRADALGFCHDGDAQQLVARALVA